MKVSLWVAELAGVFWKEAGMDEPFPRDLRRAMKRALPVDVVWLPRLRVKGVRTWLENNGVTCPCPEADRSLRACLAAWAGYGFIFLDESDPAEEQRFSLAHEVSHFLRHYWQPRRLACRRLGDRILEVLDGSRSPTPQERLQALLKNVPVGFHLHLMRRGPRGEVVSREVAVAEEEADLLAYELLAPAAAVGARVGTVQGDVGRSRVAEVLQSVFGLPPGPAVHYARLLVPAEWQDPLLRRLL